MIELRRRMALFYEPPYIPTAYQQVEYLETSGTQYIVIPTSEGATQRTITLEWEFVRLGPYFVLGGTGHRVWEIYIWPDPDGIATWDGVFFGAFTTRPTIGYRYKAVLSYNTSLLYENDILLGSGTANRQNPASLAINTIYRGGGSPGYFGYSKYYYYEQKQGDEIVKQLIPCYRKSDLVAGMYDRVNDVFYTNDGMGEFIVGPNV